MFPHCRHGVKQGFPIVPGAAVPRFCENGFIAGKLAGFCNLSAHKMYKGIEPVQADSNLYKPLVKHIPAFVMGQFMQDNIPKILFTIFRSRQYDTGAKKTDQHRRGNQRIDTQFHGAFHAFPLRNNGKPVQHFHIGNRRQSVSDISYKTLIDCHLPYQQHQRNHQPDQPDITRQQFPRLPKRVDCSQIFFQAI